VLTPEYWAQLKALGVTVVAIMVERNEPRWDPYWRRSQLEAAAFFAIQNDMELVLTTWPAPQKDAIDQMCSAMIKLLSVGVVAWEIDVEGLWKRSKVRDFASLEEAELYLLSLMGRIAPLRDVRIELTTHTGHRECGPHARMTPQVDRFLPQAYSVRHRGQAEIDWDDKLGPGNCQRWALTRARRIPDVDKDCPKLCVGLAAYDQQWPGRPVSEAMAAALDAALTFSPHEVRYWSSKWVMKRPEVASFLAKRWGNAS
jgi:hypothetical protein